MRKNVSLWSRMLIMGLVALGLFGMGTVSVLAQGEVCVLDNRLAVADQNKDGVVTIAELDRVIELTGNASVQASRDRIVAAGVTGIRYTECAPTGQAPEVPELPEVPEAPEAPEAPASGTGGADGTDGADGTSTDGADGTSTDGADGTASVTTLPETGVGSVTTQDNTSVLMLGTGSMLLLGGALIFRLSRKA
jgi:hypothetical protein